MGAQGNAAPVIIKRKKVSGGDGHHGGAWKVAIVLSFSHLGDFRPVRVSPKGGTGHSDRYDRRAFRDRATRLADAWPDWPPSANGVLMRHYSLVRICLKPCSGAPFDGRYHAGLKPPGATGTVIGIQA